MRTGKKERARTDAGGLSRSNSGGRRCERFVRDRRHRQDDRETLQANFGELDRLGGNLGPRRLRAVEVQLGFKGCVEDRQSY
jgi:hypothetical protein